MPRKQTNKIGVMLTVDIDMDDVIRSKKLGDDLRRLGLDQPEFLKAIGVVQGRVPEEAVESLADVPGVSLVERVRDDYTTQAG